MSNHVYPEWWEDTITVYNKYEDSQTHVITWFRSVHFECFWKYVRDKATIGQTVLESEKIICRIPESRDFKETHIWKNIPNDQKSNYFTLSVGDIVVKGDVDDEIDEYLPGHRSTDLIAKFKALQGCMEVQSASINVGAGRCDPHYLAQGL